MIGKNAMSKDKDICIATICIKFFHQTTRRQEKYSCSTVFQFYEIFDKWILIEILAYTKTYDIE